MYRISYVLGGDRPYRDRAMRILLATLTMVDKEYIRANPDAPHPLSLKYKEESEGHDDWLDASALATLKEGDCEELCAYTAAWLQVRRGVNAWPQLQEDEHGCTHVVVGLPNGKLCDPTRHQGRCETCGHACTSHGKNDPEEKITFVTDLFRSDTRFGEGLPAFPQNLAHKSLSLMLHALYLIDVLWLRLHPETPLLYTTNVRYELEPPGREDWQDWPTTLRRGVGDCEDLANMRSAELFVKAGIKARPTFIWKPKQDGSNLYHIIVAKPDGTEEDPSRRLGMP